MAAPASRSAPRSRSGVCDPCDVAVALFAYPDEAAHVIKAEAVVRGQLLGREASTRRGRLVLPFRAVQVPGILSNAGVTQDCYSTNPRQPARVR